MDQAMMLVQKRTEVKGLGGANVFFSKTSLRYRLQSSHAAQELEAPADLLHELAPISKDE